MTKTTYSAIFLILAVMTLALLIFKKPNHPKTRLRCDTELTAQLNIASETSIQAVLNTKVHFFFYHNGKGFIRLNGYLEYKGKIYILDRELWYSYGDADNVENDDDDDDGVYLLRFTRDLKHISDTVPYEIWQYFLQSEDPNISYHTSIEKMIDNLYLISTLPSPSFVCRGY